MEKHSGILCHLTSLPTLYGIGDFGPVAYQFIDELSRANQHYWQILPIGKTDDSGCPYATDSAFGCADYYISPDLLIQEYQLDPTIFNQYFLETDRVDFRRARENKQKMLALTYLQFSPTKSFKQFILQEKYWIKDYCTFRALSETRGPLWRNWGSEKLSTHEKKLINFHQFCQFVGFSQMENLKKYANSKNIKIVGDLPIFISYNSMDVWKNPQQFFLNDTLDMEYEAGAAPDAFSKTGQKWGTPLYNWNYQKQNNYDWWKQRLSFLKRYFDVIRIDHFRGFCATWISKVSDLDATNGHWYPGPSSDLFFNLHESPEIIAEDLGYITPDVDKLRNQFSFPGMRVFQFLLGESDNPHKLYNYHTNTVAYSGTHDCDTLMGWFQHLTSDERTQVERELKIKNPNHWEMLKILMTTPSQIVFIQMQDLLGLGTEARFNYPGTVQALNWTWKMTMVNFQQIEWKKLSQLTQESGRSSNSWA